MVRLDKFISGVRNGILLEDNDFELLDFDRFGNVISVKYKGVYVIADNGYLQGKSADIPPFIAQHFRHAPIHFTTFIVPWMTTELSTLKCQYASWYAVKIEES